MTVPPGQLRQLATILLSRRKSTRKEIAEWRAQHASLLPSVDCIAEWLVEWQMKKRRGRRPQQPSTLYGMIRAGLSRLVAQLGNRDPRHLEGEEAYAELYQSVLEDAPSIGMKRRAALALRSFHQFLQERYDAPEMEPTLLAVRGRGLSRVDANLLDLHTYFRARDWLKRSAEIEFGAEIAMQLSLVPSLAYFGGLRRSEALGLRRADLEILEESDTILLLLRDNDARRIKTRSGVRSIPLHWLMPPGEQNRVREWALRRDRDDPSGEGPLFPAFVRDGRVLDRDPRLQWIRVALKQATGDATLRFHHLRHSFASWLTLKLWVAENGIEALPEWWLPTEHDRQRLSISPRERQSLLGLAPTNRRTMLQVSSLMGHSGLDITLHSYIHIADLLLGRMVRRMTPELSPEVVAHLSGYSLSHIKNTRLEWRQRHAARPSASDHLDDIATRILSPGSGRPGAPQRLEKVKFGGQMVVGLPTTPFERWHHRMQGVVKVMEQPGAMQEISTLTGLSHGMLLQVASQFSRLPPGIAQDDRHSGPASPLYTLPQGEAHLAMARRAIETVHRLYRPPVSPPHDASSDGINPLNWHQIKQVQEAIATLLTGWVKGSALDVKIHKVAAAKVWRWLLEEMGLRPAAVVYHHPRALGSGPARDKQQAYWAKALGLPVVDHPKLEVSDLLIGETRGIVTIHLDLKQMPREFPYRKSSLLTGVRLALIGWHAIEQAANENRKGSGPKEVTRC